MNYAVTADIEITIDQDLDIEIDDNNSVDGFDWDEQMISISGHSMFEIRFEVEAEDETQARRKAENAIEVMVFAVDGMHDEPEVVRMTNLNVELAPLTFEDSKFIVSEWLSEMLRQGRVSSQVERAFATLLDTI